MEGIMDEWIKLSNRTMTDGFTLGMSGGEFKAWVFLLLYVKAFGYGGSARQLTPYELALLARVDESDAVSMFKKAGEKIKVIGKRVHIVNWALYQTDPRSHHRGRDRAEPGESGRNLDTETETETETEKKTTDKDSVRKYADKVWDFEEIWKIYPSPKGKKAAFAHFKTSVKTEDDWLNIQKALANYLRSGNVQRGYIMNGSTWFNNWQDWVNPTPAMMKGGGSGTYEGPDKNKFRGFIDRPGDVRQSDGLPRSGKAGELSP
jgi:hypothetical protein